MLMPMCTLPAGDEFSGAEQGLLMDLYLRLTAMGGILVIWLSQFVK